ncbi:uncharacterized protein BT62DRAFT_936891 [Guyanagaster necrorhizus]|uniref:Tetratricopeptide repeat protein 39B n=1 Tax=Guyanagaster necrorhizus TaxID=856835 RepID=A0A9P7VKE6_9AGAR|nr:uncharacterized protein BT62DRAFT_936891 [Guyanagaster necrorhizus MCA 3950]KAG7441581.1 hypothetical protein BT62DRAFT_936891 [Guyanagaster necrorhizus MCA 3950]
MFVSPLLDRPAGNGGAVDVTGPAVKVPYNADEALDDIPAIARALDLFLASQMVESEDYCSSGDPNRERMYFCIGYGLIQCIKAVMSYDDDDIVAAIGHARHATTVASKHRKVSSFTSKLAGYVVPSLHTTGISLIQSMTPVERHAELIYAESIFEKSMLAVIYSGDWLAFAKEAINMRTSLSIYRLLYKYIKSVDDASPNGYDDAIDEHFRTGVYLGAGVGMLVLSLLPSRVIAIVEIFGYHGDRHEALAILAKAGGWTRDSDEPTIPASKEGLRRPFCDMTLVVFHLILSSFTFEGVDVRMADKIIRWHAKRYPNGVFFLFGSGRLALVQSRPEEALKYYARAIEVQSQYRTLHHISFWEMAIANLALWDIKASLGCWTELEREATWSKAIYAYGMAVCLLETGGDARRLMEKVPDLRQKIAGKSIPLEKLVARKARKFLSQDYLALPALEMAYQFLAIAHAPREVVVTKMLVEVKACLQSLRSKDKKRTPGYWDDFCLAKFLEGVCMRYVAYPDPDVILPPNAPSVDDLAGMSQDEAAITSISAFEAVFEAGPNIELDHHIVYYAHYELGRLLACQGKDDEARKQFNLVLSGKHLEVGPSGKKGKYSMENALHMRAHAAQEALGKRAL